jgi:hypothetical protein
LRSAPELRNTSDPQAEDSMGEPPCAIVYSFLYAA